MEFIDISALVAQAINIAIIIFVLRKFIFIPYLSYIDTEISKREELETKLSEAQIIVSDAEMDAKKIRESAKSDAKKIREDAVILANTEIQSKKAASEQDIAALKAKAASDIEQERKTLEVEIEKKVMQVALHLNEKLFGKNEANEAFISHQMK